MGANLRVPGASPAFLPRHIAAAGLLIALPLAGLAVLLAQPNLDVWWENHPAHFWLVLAAGGLNAALAYATGVAARRRGDARVLLVSLAFLAAAGFLGLHALATPGVLLETPNAGFTLATPLGLVVAGAFAAASSLDLSGERATWVVQRAGLLQNGLVAVLVVWGAASVAALPRWPIRARPSERPGPWSSWPASV